MKCAYHGLDDGTRTCGDSIVHDPDSPSGYKHSEGQPFHWASPTPYGHGEAETLKIFVPCKICGKKYSETNDHQKIGGHIFKAQT